MKKKRKLTTWHKMDNTANVFPIVASRRMTNVFRLTAILKETIDAQLLQTAVETTLLHFRAFRVRMRHGLFWSYFETNDAKITVDPERDSPCRYLDPVDTNRYLFRVLYYENRVSLEVFHAISDGTGAMRFLKAICYAYIKLAHPNDFTKEQLAMAHGTQGASIIDDEYVKNYVPSKSKTFREKTAFKMKGEFRAPDNIGVLTALIPVEEIKEQCKRYDASLTEYLTALLGYGIYKEYVGQNGSKKPVSIFVLVDLRKIFGTDTSVNFFSNIIVALTFSKTPRTFEDVMHEVKECFKNSITREYFEKKLSFTVKSETNMLTRIIPLPLKRGIVRIVYEHSNHGATLPFSNLGVVQCENGFDKYFDGFRFLLYSSERDAIKCTAVSFGGTLALSFTTYLEGFALARYLVRELTQQGVYVELESNGDENEIL